MIVNLDKLDFRHAKELIVWCVANNIDKTRANELYFAWYEKPPGNYVWELDVPEQYVTYFMLKWNYDQAAILS